MCVRASECVAGEQSMVIMLIFLFLSRRWKNTFFYATPSSPHFFFSFLPSGSQSSATYAAHFYAPAGVVTGTEIWESGQLWVVAC